MPIEKKWINRKEKEHSFILFNDNTIYRVQVNEDQFSNVNREISQGKISDKFIGLPIHYIKTIEFKEDDINLKIKHGKESEDEIRISDHILRKEIFDYVKNHSNIKRYAKQKPSLLKRIKKPLTALGVVVGTFTFVYSYIDKMNRGYVYELEGNEGLGGIILALAQFGLINNLLIFCPLALIACYRIWTNYKDDAEIHYLYY